MNRLRYGPAVTPNDENSGSKSAVTTVTGGMERTLSDQKDTKKRLQILGMSCLLALFKCTSNAARLDLQQAFPLTRLPSFGDVRRRESRLWKRWVRNGHGSVHFIEQRV
jgi:hypothetical protein